MDQKGKPGPKLSYVEPMRQQSFALDQSHINKLNVLRREGESMSAVVRRLIDAAEISPK